MYVKKTLKMTENNSPAPPLSPRRYLCSLDYSKLGEKLDKLEGSPKLLKSERDQNRLKWIQLIVKLNKIRSMQPLYKYLKDSSFIQSVVLSKQRLYFQKMQKELLRKKWLRLKNQLVKNYKADRFDSKGIKVRGVRVKQTTLYLTQNNSSFIQPDFSGLIKLSISPSLEPIHSLKGEGTFENKPHKDKLRKESRKESKKELKEEIKTTCTERSVKKNPFFKKEAIKLYILFIVIGLIIGYLLYKCYHKKLYSFLKLKDSEIQQMTQIPKDEDSSLNNINGPSQDSILQNPPDEAENAANSG